MHDANMNELEEIKNWLNSDRDYDRGVMLHIAYFKDPSMRSLLERSRNSDKLFEVLKKRFYELKENVNPPDSYREVEVKQVPVKQPAKPKATPAGQIEEKIPAETKDEILQPLNDRWAQVKLEMETWHTEVFLLHENNPVLEESQRKQCAGLAGKILQHEEELQQLSLAFNHFRVNGKLPEGYVIAPVLKEKTILSSANMTATEKVLTLKNSVNPNISKLKKKIADKTVELPKLKGNKHDTLKGKIADWEKQLSELEEQKRELLK